MSGFSESTTARINSELKRLADEEQKEMSRLQGDYQRNWYAGPKDGDIYTWEGAIKGPDVDMNGRPSPYKDGWFKFTITFPTDYPNPSPPEVRFTTPIFHPSISSDGSPCADMLRLGGKIGVAGSTYSGQRRMVDVLKYMYSMLKSPSSESPVNPMIQKLLEEDYNEFYKLASDYTQKHAISTEGTESSVSTTSASSSSAAAVSETEASEGK
jgi:ubiquitin-protein ligase